MATSAKFPKIICRVRALYAFSSTEKSSLSFEKDEYIEVLSQLDSGWWDGWCKGNRGWFPSNYVQIIDVNPTLVKEMNLNNSGRTSPTSPTPYPPNQHDDDSEEEARTINLIRNMNNGSTAPLSRPHSLTLSVTKQPTTLLRRQQQPIQQYQHDDDDEEDNDSNLPEGWTLQVADDGLTKFYFNQQTGGLRWNHPGISDSEDDCDDSSADEEYEQIDHFDDYDFGKSTSTGITDYSRFPTPPPAKERTVDVCILFKPLFFILTCSFFIVNGTLDKKNYTTRKSLLW